MPAITALGRWRRIWSSRLTFDTQKAQSQYRLWERDIVSKTTPEEGFEVLWWGSDGAACAPKWRVSPGVTATALGRESYSYIFRSQVCVHQKRLDRHKMSLCSWPNSRVWGVRLYKRCQPLPELLGHSQSAIKRSVHVSSQSPQCTR